MPDAVTVGVPVFVTDGLFVEVLVTVELCVVDRVAVILGFIVEVGETVVVMLGVVVTAPVPDLDPVCIGVCVPDPVTLGVLDVVVSADGVPDPVEGGVAVPDPESVPLTDAVTVGDPV